jgi:hypothetical protein
MTNNEEESPSRSDTAKIESGGEINGRSDETISNDQGDGEARMTKAKWLACFALALSYTTAFQQGACLSAIVKSIDEALGTDVIIGKGKVLITSIRTHGLL